ncbi:MAG: winged helix-turn-helix domain-containing protein, partial [Myxococcota bacterium]
MSTERIELGPFTLEVGEFRLARDGAPVALQPKALELLIALVRAGGDLRTRDQLRTALWPDVVVTEQSLRQVVMRLREALGPAHEAWVQTVPRKGLRFDGPIARAPVVASPSLGSVPAERDALIGRAAELELLTAAVEAGRLVSILGPGGIGKTRLAAHLARSWPTGAWFCALADARTLDGVVAAVAATLGVALDGADPLERLGYAIAARGPCLIVLDNAEQVVDEIRAALHRWLDRAAEARFVVTTRRRLGVPGERLIALDPLTQPAAEQLFRVRAAAVRPGLPDDGAVAALVGLVDRLPLAIELAAARVGVLTPAAIRDRLSQRFELLREEGRPARQQSLTAVLDWSWELLAPAEQDAAVALAVFEGGASLEAAEARIGLERLQALVDQCWVRSVGGRFEMLSTLQAYARDRSTDLQGAEAAHGRSFA